LFLRKEQEFVWGEELKSGLTELNQFYEAFRDEIEKKGVMGFAVYPPEDRDFFVTQLWDRHCWKWRERKEEHKDISEEEWARMQSHGKKKMKEALQAPPVRADAMDFEANNPEFLLRRLVKKKKGSWWQAPKNLKFPKS
jgi:hypothetical protein